jgi:hypothetical protein
VANPPGVLESSPTSGRRGMVVPGWLPQPHGNVTAAIRLPRRAGVNSDVSRYFTVAHTGWSFVPTEAIPIAIGHGALPWSDPQEPVQSERLTRSAPRSTRSAGSSGVNTRGSAAHTVGPGRGRLSYLSGSTSAQHIRGAIAPEPKGLS